jgi:NAD(P)-dependent dehydrogenase (short-subunit alcohol dehydrogenase family)
MIDLAGKRALVVGASRGFGKGVDEALAEAGADVHTLSRTAGSIRGDAMDPVLAARLLRELAPNIVVVNAGATPPAAPLQEQTWQSFSTSWDVDVKIAFHWLKATLAVPLPPGSRVITVSSGAALRGSPLSGGYAGAKAMVRFLTEYAAEEARRANLTIRYATLLPKITPEGGVGRAFVEAYARRQGTTVEAFLGAGAPLRPSDVGAAVLRLVRERALDDHVAFLLDATALKPLGV